MNEREASKLYYLVDAIVGDPGKADEVLEAEVKDAVGSDGAYLDAIVALRGAIAEIKPASRDHFKTVVDHFAHAPADIDKQVGHAVQWAMDIRGARSPGLRMGEQKPDAGDDIDLLGMI